MNFTASDELWGLLKQAQETVRGVHMQNAYSTSGDEEEQDHLDNPPSDDEVPTSIISKRAAHDTANNNNKSAPPRKKRKGALMPSSSSLISSVGGVGSSTHHPSWGTEKEPNKNKNNRNNKNRYKRKLPEEGELISWDLRFTKRWKRYKKTRLATLKKDRARQNSDIVARAHDQKAARLQAEHKHTFRQLRDNILRSAAEKGSSSSSSNNNNNGRNDNNNNGRNDSEPRVQPSLPRRGWSKIQEARVFFAAASCGLRRAERRYHTARLAEQSFLDAARTLIAARRDSEENLRMALAQAHPYWDLVRWRLERDLRQSIADTSEIVLLSTTGLLSRASNTAVAQAKVDLFFSEKMAARLNRERQVCRVNGAGDDSSPPLRLRRVKCRRNFSVPLPRRTTALVAAQASLPDSRVSPRLQVVFSQLRAIDTAAAKMVAEA